MTTPSLPPKLSEAFAQALRANRSRFNAKFAEARHFRPRLTAAAFKEVLQNMVTPIVAAVEAVAPAQVAPVVDVLYELALDLLGQELLGPHSRYPFINQGWQQLLPQLAPHIAQAPRLVVGAITNALYQLAQTPGARPAEWLNLMHQLAQLGPDTNTLLQSGQVAAWRAGMAHYRVSALQLCAQLPPALATVALGLPPSDFGATHTALANLLAQLNRSPWQMPAASAASDPAQLQVKQVARVGAFRGFGGLFLTPPTVTCAGEQLVVQADGQAWALFADAWGATFHRLEAAPKNSPASTTLPFKVDSKGKINWGAHQGVFSALVPVHSSAANATTLAVTSTLSHAVFLFALG